MTLPTPWRAFSRACASSASAFHSGRQTQTTIGPKVSVRPYRWVISIPSCSMRSSIAGVGGAPPVPMRTRCAPAAASGCQASISTTVGAACRWVMPSSRSSCQMRAGSMRRRHTCTPPAAVTAHGKHQPLQWNMGSVHR